MAQQTMVRVPFRYSWTWSPARTLVFVAIMASVLAYTLMTTGIVKGPSSPVVPPPQFAAEATATPTVVPTAAAVPIHVEWTQVGVAHNGDEVIALGIPWDNLIRVPMGLIENLPPGVTRKPGGLPTERGTIILYTFAEIQPWVFTYWQSAEIPCATVKGLCP